MNHFKQHRKKKYVYCKVYILYVNGDKYYSMESEIPLIHNKVVIPDIHITGTKENPLLSVQQRMFLKKLALVGGIEMVLKI